MLLGFLTTPSLAYGSTQHDVGSSQPPRTTPQPTHPPIPTPSRTERRTSPTITPTLSTVPPTPNPIVGPTPIIDPSPSIPGTSSFIPSANVQQQSDDRDDFNDPFPTNRPFIEPYGKGFYPSRVASQAVTRCIKQQFLKPWTSWFAIPDDDRELFWKRFKQKVQWMPEHEVQIKRNFHSKASHRLSEMFREARIAGERPRWVGEGIWHSLLAHWNTPAYRVKCATAQKNRASEKGGALHIGGSITEDFSTRLTQAREDVGGAPDATSRTNANEDIIKTQCWVDVVGGKKKGRIYGAGQLASHYTVARGGVLKHQSSSSNTIDQHNMVSREAYDELRSRLQTFEDILRKYIPEAGQILDPSSSHQTLTQPMQPTNVQSPNQQEPLV
ncbi:uncharacterized protein LOC106780142 [Vigna radiata var. radiata]|uniref:Uncharacterized protein LOC106780142 n=1 Tax=Vigna radiata var. radiata TaxID=3916 RepID=A0A1S3VZV0_VIGRR|nr:uncharacterized protein LOC106780142 [Vigna radiata var. radiata]